MKIFFIILSVVLFIAVCILAYLNNIYKKTIIKQYYQQQQKKTATFSPADYAQLYNNFVTAIDMISDINEIYKLEYEDVAVAPLLNVQVSDEDNKYSVEYLRVWKEAYREKLDLLYQLLKDELKSAESSGMEETSLEKYQKMLTYVGWCVDKLAKQKQ